MQFTTLEFLIFILVGVVVYYIVPKKHRWIWLLILSYGYYCSFRAKAIVYLLFITAVTYFGGLLLGMVNEDSKAILKLGKETFSKEEKKAFKEKTKRRKRVIVTLIMLAAFGLLGVCKYLEFIINNINDLVTMIGHGQHLPLFAAILPLGLSFFTFQSASYVIDIYNDKYEPEKNPFKYALFVAWFPQILQGPIGRFDRLAKQLIEGNTFALIKIQHGVQRILWGMFKKVVLSDRATVIVDSIVSQYDTASGFLCIMSVLFYSIELYADFSGGIDIVLGAAELFGVKMDENFRQPYFSKSIGEFWRRWHISLGAWMKDYIFYPFSLSKAMNKFGKWGKKHFPNTVAKALPICVANILIFFIVGVWHGAEWKFIMYGFYNGFIIAISALLEPVYEKMFAVTHINKDSKPWQCFAVFRTFILVNIGWFFDIGTDMTSTMSLMTGCVTRFHLADFAHPEVLLTLGLDYMEFVYMGIGLVILIIVSVFKEKGVVIREAIDKKPLPVRWVLYMGLIMMIFLFGYTGVTQGFIYANF